MLETANIPVEEQEVSQFLCHIYHLHSYVTCCGIPVRQDKHAMMHIEYEQVSEQFPTGDAATHCPVCNAPVCKICLEEFQTSEEDDNEIS